MKPCCMANGFVRIVGGGGIYTRGLDVIMSDGPDICSREYVVVLADSA